ncbi:MAG: hypothetical protein KIT72_01595 [Polyangiaceae bacterium]|nr:hypothetical protein [Polyangiaceae bacterium]MCW5789091.1 hypothetical protein [Polyangiaceae bacterium]
MSVLVFAASLGLNIIIPWWVVRLSERFAKETAERHGWSEASFRAAVVVFGPLSLPVHFARLGAGPRGLPRVVRVVLGLVLGAVMMLLAALLAGIVISLLGWLLGAVQP